MSQEEKNYDDYEFNDDLDNYGNEENQGEDKKDFEKLYKEEQTANRRLYARLKKVDEGKKDTVDTKEEAPAVPSTDPALITEINKLKLAQFGYNSADEQDEILKIATGLGQSVEQVVQESFVQARINEMRTARNIAENTPDPSKGAPQGGKDANWYIEKGEMPEDEAMYREVSDELVRRAKE